MGKSNDAAKIAETLALLDDKQRKLHARAIKEGCKDEVCPECGIVLLAYQHFLPCRSSTCPMKLRDDTGHAPNLLEMLDKGVPGSKP